MRDQDRPSAVNIVGTIAVGTIGLTFAIAAWFRPGHDGFLSTQTVLVVGIVGGTLAHIALSLRASGVVRYGWATGTGILLTFGILAIGLLTDPMLGGAYFVGAGSAFMLCEAAVLAERWARSRRPR